jgi:hypothetical protein
MPPKPKTAKKNAASAKKKVENDKKDRCCCKNDKNDKCKCNDCKCETSTTKRSMCDCQCTRESTKKHPDLPEAAPTPPDPPVQPTPPAPPAQPAPRPKPPLIGSITYTLTVEAENSLLRSEIVDGMDAAIDTYNRYSNFNTHITAHYDSNVPTAEASGTTITFGSMVGYRVSLHEIAHVLGIGTRGGWWSSKVHAWDEMVWVGRRGIAKIQELDGPDAVLHADGLHFWNYGLNWQQDLVGDADWKHVEVVDAMVSDMIETEDLERLA